MKVTNRFKMPYPFYKAACSMQRPYENGTYHVTDIISPPQIIALRKKYWDKLEQDCSDMVWAIFGSAVHSILEKTNSEQREILVEQQLEMNVNGVKIVGTPDVYTDKTESVHGVNCITDWKTAGLYVHKNGIKREWIAQLNIYKLMFESVHPDFTAHRLENVVFFKDWTKSAARRQFNYPQTGAAVYEVPIWDKEYTLDYVKNCVNEHIAASDYVAGKIRPCTDEETWLRGECYKIFKNSNKSCVPHCTFDNIGDVASALYDLRSKNDNTTNRYRAEKHTGTRARCEDNWCLVNKFCPQFKAMYPNGVNFAAETRKQLLNL